MLVPAFPRSSRYFSPDPCLFFKIDDGGNRIECAVFVDDLLVVSKCMKMIEVLKAALEARFNNNIGVVTWDWNATSYLGIGVQYDRDTHTLRMNVNVALKLKKLSEELPLLTELSPIDARFIPPATPPNCRRNTSSTSPYC